MSKRIFWIDFGKGMTIFLVVLAHTLANINNNLNYSNNSFIFILRFCMYIMFIVIMPVFFAISGYLHKSVVSKKQYIKLIKKKLLTLGVPYLFFSILLVFLSTFTPLKVEGVSGLTSLLFIWFKPISYLWFLYSLFLCFIIVGGAQLLRINNTVQFIIYLILTIVFEFVPGTSSLYYISQTFSWTLCFFIGYLYREIVNNMDYKKIVIVSSILCISSIIWQMLGSNIWYLQGDFFTLPNTLAKLFSVLLVFSFYSHVHYDNFSRYFSKYGKKSLVIYLVHVPIISFLRKFFVLLGISNIFILVFCIFIFSWYLSIFADMIISKFKMFDFVFYPNKYIKLK